MAKKKQVIKSTSVREKRVGKSKDVGTGYHQEMPKWRFQKIDKFHSKWALKIDDEILEKLANFETMKWKEIFIDSKKQNHTVDIGKIGKDAQNRLNELSKQKPDDMDFNLCSLRLGGKHRIWGLINKEGICYLLWNDPKHDVYPSLKKHT